MNYFYSLSTDFPQGVNSGELHVEIGGSINISSPINGITISGDTVKISFDEELTLGEKSDLDNIITTYSPPPAIDIVREEKHYEIDEKTYEIIEKGFQFDGKSFGLDMRCQIEWVYLKMFEAEQVWPARIKTMTGEIYYLQQADLHSFALTAFNKIREVFDNSITLKESVNTSSTEEAILNIEDTR
jgi:hypothetical protein